MFVKAPVGIIVIPLPCRFLDPYKSVQGTSCEWPPMVRHVGTRCQQVERAGCQADNARAAADTDALNLADIGQRREPGRVDGPRNCRYGRRVTEPTTSALQYGLPDCHPPYMVVAVHVIAYQQHMFASATPTIASAVATTGHMDPPTRCRGRVFPTRAHRTVRCRPPVISTPSSRAAGSPPSPS